MQNGNSRLGRTSLAVVTLLALSGAVASARAEDNVSAADDASSPFIVKIHADWCGTCTALNPTWEDLEASLGSKARLVVLDVTDKEALGRSRAEAERLGISGFFKEYRGRTGVIAVLDGATREPVSVMKGVRKVAPYEQAVARATGETPS